MQHQFFRTYQYLFNVSLESFRAGADTDSGKSHCLNVVASSSAWQLNMAAGSVVRASPASAPLDRDKSVIPLGGGKADRDGECS